MIENQPSLLIDPPKHEGMPRNISIPTWVVITASGLLSALLIVTILTIAQSFYWKGVVDTQVDYLKESDKKIIEWQQTQETYNQNLRENLAAHGWSLDRSGNLKRKD